MSYKSKTIKQVVMDIESSKMYLPALQRKFVWGKYQIEILFDSLMRNYPIGTFLFWNLKEDVANNYVFYEFLKEYDQRNPYNRRKQGNFLHEIIGVLDGQQRLSSMYIGLQGSHTEKRPYMHWSNERAFEPTNMYLNLLSLPYLITEENTIETNEEVNFEFCFLTTHDAQHYIHRKLQTEDGQSLDNWMYWFKVGDVLSWKEDVEYDMVLEKLTDLAIDENQKQQIKENSRFIKKALERLYRQLTRENLINYFEINKTDLEDILKIFVRVNSGGTVLSKGDLLFSTIVATWDDGRDKIEHLLRTINAKGEGFNFQNDYLMRCLLVLTDAPVLYKVNSFRSDNVERMRDNWDRIASAIKGAIDILVEFGFNSSLLPSQNSTIIIAYYIYKGGVLNDETKRNWRKYLIHALLKNLYSNSQDQLITALRNALRSKEQVNKEYVLRSSHFDFEELTKQKLPSRKSFLITDEDLELFLSYKKGAGAFFVLSLLYPQYKYQTNSFHQDHIHPDSGFNEATFSKLSLSEEERAYWLSVKDTIPNLQLMEGKQNNSKNDKAFKDWLDTKPQGDIEHFLHSNFIPKDLDLTFSNFEQFYIARRAKIKEELMKVLSMGGSNIVADSFKVDEEIVEQVDYTLS